MSEEKQAAGKAFREPPMLESKGRRRHDFKTPRLISEAEVRALEALHRKFCRAAATALSVLARARVQVDLLGIQQRPYFEFIRSLESPSSLHLVYCLPRRIPFVFELSPRILFPLLERLLGGKGEETVEPARPLTRIEQGLSKTVAEEILHQLREAWSPREEASPCSPGPGVENEASEPGKEGPRAAAAASEALRFDVVESEHNPLLMQIVAPSEPSLILSFEVTLEAASSSAAESVESATPSRPRSSSGLFHLCLPTRPFHAVLSRLSRTAWNRVHLDQQSAPERDRILKQIERREMSLEAELASVPVALSDLLALRPGDVIDTQLGATSEVSLLFEGRKVFRGTPAIRGGRRAVKITRADLGG